MTRTAVIVDTNVVVAALLSANDASPVARILDGMLAAAFPFVVSEALLAGYRTVLVRPNLRKLHGSTVVEVEAILTDIAQHAVVLAPASSRPAPDPGDPLSWEMLAASRLAVDHGRRAVAARCRHARARDFAECIRFGHRLTDC